ncbi:cathepsin L-like [Scaptodrosophila lebanonensis]|uniref:cathepsin L n=1 Tax=Drosophila lebanonensis TaxID=7225 RepID=A0A6J2TA26_DROLE|nr:cathepsin L-like [Scaptodrosophila lebanonensis]
MAAEDNRRYNIFTNNKLIIEEHNERWKNGTESYQMGINQFSDMLPEELELYTTGRISSSQMAEQGNHTVIFMPPPHVTLPKEVDWREYNAVTPVFKQGDCSSCWAVVAAGVLESQYFMKTRQLIPLSVQNLLDCSSKYGNYNCSGGLARNALKYVRDNGGVDTQKAYPYKGVSEMCQYQQKNEIPITIEHICNIPKGDERAMAFAVAFIGPVAAGINSITGLHGYKGGVFYNKHCSQVLTHEVLVIGFGTDPQEGDYWLIKNSWGTAWGEKGFGRIARNRDNQCGIASDVLVPLI